MMWTGFAFGSTGCLAAPHSGAQDRVRCERMPVYDTPDIDARSAHALYSPPVCTGCFHPVMGVCAEQSGEDENTTPGRQAAQHQP